MAEAQRTLVKSPPEIWAEVSDPQALTRHLGAFGEIRITRAEPESTVAWEGTRARGTVELAPAGWGTKVTVTAEEVVPEPVAAEPEPVVEPVAVEPEPEPAPRPGFWARLFGRRKAVVDEQRQQRESEGPLAVAASEPVAPTLASELEAAVEPSPAVELSVLEEMLASLGAAHHRPFSRG